MPRRLRAAQHGVIRQAGGVELGCAEILELKVREFLQDIGIAHPGPEHLEDILHANPHSPDAGFTPALIRIDRDAFEQVHAGTMAARAAFAKLGGVALERPPGGPHLPLGQQSAPFTQVGTKYLLEPNQGVFRLSGDTHRGASG